MAEMHNGCYGASMKPAKSGLLVLVLFAGVMMAHGCGRGPGHPAEVRLRGRSGADDAYNRGDYATALRIFRQLADQGDARAQYNLGYMYANGKA